VAELLSAVVRATTVAAGPDALLDRVARLLLPYADWVLADRLEDPDLIVRVAGYDRDGSVPVPMAHTADRLPRRSAAGALGLLPEAMAAPGKMLRLDDARLKEIIVSGAEYASLQAEAALTVGTSDMLIVVLHRREQQLGVLSVGLRGGCFDDDLLTAVADVATHLGEALYAARLEQVQAAVATALQTSLLPAMPVVDGLRFAARYAPAVSGADVGGDWFDVFAAPSGTTVVVGDTAGHDIVAAAVMAELRNLLRALAVDRAESSASLLDRLDRTAASLGIDVLATCLVGQLVADRDSWRLTWSSAGHLPPVLVRGGAARLLEATPDLLLGVDPTLPRTDHVEALTAGDLLLLYTDGLVERPGVPIGDRLEVLRETVERLRHLAPDPLADELLAKLAGDAADDIALLAIAVS
jgi:serine phosphatase RsbU (regulator of sigma subunit)